MFFTLQIQIGLRLFFLVSNSKHLEFVKDDTVVVYDEVITNNGYGYDVKTGEFIAPADGLYFFTWTSVTYKHTLVASYLEMNGKLVAQNHACARDVNEHISATQSVVLQMKKNHIVLIKVYKTIDGVFFMLTIGLHLAVLRYNFLSNY